MSQPALKCENNAIFKQKYTLKLFITFKMAYSCYFLDLFPKSVIASTTGHFSLLIEDPLYFRSKGKTGNRQSHLPSNWTPTFWPLLLPFCGRNWIYFFGLIRLRNFKLVLSEETEETFTLVGRYTQIGINAYLLIPIGITYTYNVPTCRYYLYLQYTYL